LQRAPRGYFQALVEGVEPGSLYTYRLDGQKERPDPASRYQPQDVHGPSQVVEPHFAWQDRGWFGLPLQQYIIYELHVGTFTPEGTFDAIIPYLDELKELGQIPQILATLRTMNHLRKQGTADVCVRDSTTRQW
jgi:maltooligosyltrehalose trehalohydrolase